MCACSEEGFPTCVCKGDPFDPYEPRPVSYPDVWEFGDAVMELAEVQEQTTDEDSDFYFEQLTEGLGGGR